MIRTAWFVFTTLLAIVATATIVTRDTGAASQSDVALSFPAGATVSVAFPASEVVDNQLFLIWKSSQDDTPSLAPAELVSSGDGMVTATVALDLQQDFVPPGVTIDFQWHTGSRPFVPIGEPESFNWFDSRWEWQTSTSGPVTVHTYGSGTTASAEILDSATATLETMRADYGIHIDEPISIWAYTSPADFAGTLQTNAREAVAGVSYPEHGVISAILPIGQPAETARIIPHEISHLALFRATSNPWNAPPLWFDEGLAVYVQSGGTTSYEQILERVARENELFGLDAISYVFPYSAADASQAYAQSWSIVAWMHDVHGVDAVARLIDAFGSGVSWDESVQVALGTDLASLEREWHAQLHQRYPATSARLFETWERITETGRLPSQSRNPEQELPRWPSTLADRSARRFSIQLRSSESWR